MSGVLSFVDMYLLTPGMIINNDASSGENSNVNIQQVKEGTCV